MSPNNKAALTLIKNLKGVMMVLNEEAISAVDHFHATYCPKYEDLEVVSNGGDNIRFAPLGNGFDKWGSFDKKKPLQPFCEQVGSSIQNYWKKGKPVFEMKYEIAYLVSDLDDAKDNYPQKVHINIHLDITEIEWNFF